MNLRIAAQLLLTMLVSATTSNAQNDNAQTQRVMIQYTGTTGKSAIMKAASSVHHEFDRLSVVAASVPDAALNGLSNRPDIDFIEVDIERKLFDVMRERGMKGLRGSNGSSIMSRPDANASTAVNRKLVERTFGIEMVKATEQLHTDYADLPDEDKVKVCIIDSGYDTAHPDLRADVVQGYSGKGKPTWMIDKCGHGTHVAGTICAESNTVGVVGVAPGSPVYIVQVFDQSNCGWSFHSSDLISAAERCADQGANIISMSLGGGGASQIEANGFRDLLENRNVISIAAAGNDGNTNKSYPASYDSVMSVAAVDSNRNVAGFSQKNDAVDIAGPGVSVESTVPTGMGFVKALVVDGVDYENVGAIIGTPSTPSVGVTGELINCGYGGTTCAGATGKVCLIKRGPIGDAAYTFAEKVQNCDAGGGIAAVIYNHSPGLDIYGWTLDENGNNVGPIPCVSITNEDGEDIASTVVGGATIEATVTTEAGANYDVYSGTSMATPHVSGVAGLIWSLVGGTGVISAQEIWAALEETACHPTISTTCDSTVPRDNNYGHGIVQAEAAYNFLAALIESCDTSSVSSDCTGSYDSSCEEPSCINGVCKYGPQLDKCCNNDDCGGSEYCDNSNTCQTCTVSYCAKCNDATTCQECNAGFTLDNNGSCSSCGLGSGEKCKNNSECCSGACYVGGGAPRCG